MIPRKCHDPAMPAIQSDATTIHRLVHARSYVIPAVVWDANGLRESFTFQIAEFARPYFHEDGAKDVNKVGARTEAVAKHLFDVHEMDNAIRQRLIRCSRSAAYIIAKLSALSDDELGEAVSLDRFGQLIVPYELVASLPAKNTSNRDRVTYDALKGHLFVLDGLKGMSLAELNRRANGWLRDPYINRTYAPGQKPIEARQDSWRWHMLAIILTHRSTDDAMAAHKASGRFVDDRLDFNWAAREGYIRFA